MSTNDAERTGIRSKRIPITWILGMLVGTGIGLAVMLFLYRPQVALPEIPVVNGADALRRAAAKMSAESLQQLLGDAAVEELQNATAIREFLEAHPDARQAYNAAIGQKCVPVVDYDEGITTLLDNPAMSDVRTACYLPRLAARLAELEDRPGDAAREYAGMFSIVSQYGKDGLLVHMMMAGAMERLTLQRMLDLSPSLDADTRSEVAGTIRATPHESRDIALALQRECRLIDNEYGRFRAAYMRFVMGGMPTATTDQMRQLDAELLKLQTELLEALSPSSTTDANR